MHSSREGQLEIAPLNAHSQTMQKITSGQANAAFLLTHINPCSTSPAAMFNVLHRDLKDTRILILRQH